MNNFHFNPSSNKSIQLKKQLEMMNKEIQESKRQLEKKNLQLQFYEDPDYVNNKPSASQKHIRLPETSNNYQRNVPEMSIPQSNTNKNKYQNLADEIMNDLLQDNSSNKYKNQQNPTGANVYENQNNNNYNVYSNQQRDNAYQIQKPNIYQNQNVVPQHYQQKPSIIQPQPRQNNFIPQNKRQLEKEKLQNPSSNQQNPFIPKNQPVKRSIETKEQKPIINQRQLQKLKLQQQSGLNQNPFWGQNNNKNKSQQKSNTNKNIQYQQYQNIREKQKEKLQYQLHQNKDFGVFDRPTSPSQIPAQKDIQSQNISKKAAFQNRYSNPFAKNQDYIKQLKQEQQKEYRRVLQEQKKIEEERKKNQKQKVKEEKYAFNSYEPGTNSNPSQQIQNPIKSPALNLTKKVDPNGRPPVYNYEQATKSTISASDREFMKMKANEFRENFKKGRILHDEYISQIKKLAEYYKVNYRELVDKKDLNEKEEDLPWIINKDKKQQDEAIKIQQDKFTGNQIKELKENESENYQIMEQQQSLQKFPDSQVSIKNNQYSRGPSSPSKNPSLDPYSVNFPQPHYGLQYPPLNQFPGIYTQNLSTNPQQQYGLASTSFLQQMQGVDYELMRRMFQEMKAMRTDYTKSLEKEKAFLQETFMKFLANGIIQNQTQNQPQAQPQTQMKYQKPSQFSPQQNKKKQNNILTQNLQQSYNQQSLQFIQKSLSGIVNKIPFHSNSINRPNNSNIEQSFMMGTPEQNFIKKTVGKSDQNKNTETMQEFFNKPYKCKKFKKFSIMVDVSQSSMEIPNVSNFLALKNGKQVMNKLFEEDLLMMKKLQREKDIDKLRNRVDNQLNYGNQPSSSQQSSIQQRVLLSKQVTYGQPPNYANYQQTFNKNQVTGQFNVRNNEGQQQTSSRGNNYEEFESYSRNKSRDVKSAHQQNHRSYKKVDQSGSSENSFLKRHVSNQQEKLPDFADQSDIKGRSPVYYSPKLGSQILQQDEYQTAQKSTNQQLLQSEFYGSSVVKKVISPQPKESTNKKYKMKKKDYAYEQERQSQKKSKSKDKAGSFKQALRLNNEEKDNNKQQDNGMMKMINKNNLLLKKYQQVSPQNINNLTPRQQQQQMDIREYSSINSNPPKQEDLKDYFSNQSNNNNYSLPPLIANLGNMSGPSAKSDPLIERKLSNKFNTQKEETHLYDRQQSIEEIKSDDDGLEEDRSQYVSSQQVLTNRNQNNNPYETSQQQTVKSINYSVSSRRPPQSINISQTVESIDESASKLMRPPLSKKKSTSRKKQSSIIRTKYQKDSILQKPPPSESQVNSMIHSDEQNDLVINKQPLKFDSNIYDSEYEQSASQKDLQKRISQLHNEQKMKISQPQINISPPFFVNSSSNVLNTQGIESKSSLIGGSKLKSLQEARNLVKQSKKKSINLNEIDQMSKYEEKMSELESFLTRKEESMMKESKQPKTIKLAIKKSPSKKKNIMNLLDELENESSYKDDFESYRQESERPKY